MYYKLDNNLILTVAEAEKADAKESLKYLRQVGGESDFLCFGVEGVGVDIFKEQEIIKKSKISPTSIMLIGKINGKIVSVGTLFGETQNRFTHRSELGISVAKEYWGKGIGTILINNLLDFAKNNKYLKVISLKVLANNARAISLYKLLGFSEVGYDKMYMKIEDKFYDAIYFNYYI